MSGKKIALRIGIAAAIVVLLAAAVGLILNFTVKSSVKDKILYTFTEEETPGAEVIEELKALEAECILVLGAGITDKETPSPMLKDRLDAGIALYNEGVAPKLLLSGDNGQLEHNEIHVMLKLSLIHI